MAAMGGVVDVGASTGEGLAPCCYITIREFKARTPDPWGRDCSLALGVDGPRHEDSSFQLTRRNVRPHIGL